MEKIDLPGMVVDDVLMARALQHFGINPQVKKCIEELGELITELARSRKVENSPEIALEIADVLITVRQLSLIVGPDRVQRAIESKSSRLSNRIASEMAAAVHISDCSQR